MEDQGESMVTCTLALGQEIQVRGLIPAEKSGVDCMNNR